MAYSNIGTPRFIIDWLQWYRSLGLMKSINTDEDQYNTLYPYYWNAPDPWNTEYAASYISSTIGLNPTHNHTFTGVDDPETYGSWDVRIPMDESFPIQDCNIVGVLGHNIATTGGGITFGYYHDDGVRGASLTDDFQVNITSTDSSDAFYADHDGFSFCSCDGSSDSSNLPLNDHLRIMLRFIDNYETAVYKPGSLLWGRYYDMPHSPDLKLTLRREMDGVKRIRTKGGADLVNYKYIKPAKWGDASAWELYTGTPTNQALSRVGRRTWDLSFSYLQDSDIFPDVSSLTNYGTSGYSDTDPISDNTLLDEDTFYSQVIHKTNGGQLPFIFQPDPSNSNPDGFAICKFDMKSFQFRQVANGVYNITLKIREIW